MLLLLLLLALACASDTHMLTVTASNVDELVARGPLFVAWTAPWCGHCKTLAPSWEVFAREHAAPPALSVGKVDCTTEKALCLKFGVQAYPTLLLLRDGKAYTFNRPRNVAEFAAFARSYFQQSSTPSVPLPAPSSAVPASPAPTTTAAPAHDTAGAGTVLALNLENFLPTVARGVWLVKFYAPWCGHCKTLAPTLDEVARDASGFRVARVDCTVAHSLCSAFGVEAYPTVKVLTAGTQYDFHGPRTKQSLIDFAAGGYLHAQSQYPFPKRIE